MKIGKKGPVPTELTFTANSIPQLIIIMNIAAKEEEEQGAGVPAWETGKAGPEEVRFERTAKVEQD